jgi:hypothetical protein
VKHCNGCQHFSKHRNTLAAALKTIPHLAVRCLGPGYGGAI